MPKFKFKCTSCEQEIERFVSPRTEEADCPACSSKMARQFPSRGSQVAKEVVDSFINIRTAPDEKELNKARKTEHFWDVEVPRFIQHYSLETCLEEKWLVYNNKGELVINKPPSKR